MTSIYTDADFLSAYKQKQRIYGVFLAITLTYLAVCLGLVIYHAYLPYGSADATLPKVIVYGLSAVYTVFAFPYMTIKYHRVSRYYRAMTYFNVGLKVTETNYFFTFRKGGAQKDNVDVTRCVFATWNEKKQEWFERETYCDVEHALPDFGEGDYVRYVTQSNFILQYEILQRHAYEFDEYYEDEETGEYVKKEDLEELEELENQEGENK